MSADAQTATPARQFSLTESAVRRVAELLAQEDKPGLMLRVQVDSGGCSGFQYGFAFDDETGEDDRVFHCEHGVSVVVDQMSLDLLAGSELDWVEDLGGSSFQVRNPNAQSSCGCGASFSI